MRKGREKSARKDEKNLSQFSSLFLQKKKVDTIPLSRPRRNLSRDFSDAVLAAEVVGFLWPEAKLFGCCNSGSNGGNGGSGGHGTVPAFQPANSTSGKIYNWCVFRERVLRKIGVPATRADVEAAARGEAGAAEWVLAMLRQRAERGEREREGGREGRTAATAAKKEVVVRRKGGGVDLVSEHNYYSPMSGINCRGGWRAAALAARVRGGNETPAATARSRMSLGLGSSRREQQQPATEHKQRSVLFTPAALSSAKKAAVEQKQQQEQQAPRLFSSPAVLVRPSSSSTSSSSSLLERENDALKSQVARLERLALRQEAQIESLLEALEEASATAAAAAAAAAAEASGAPSPVAVVTVVAESEEEERQQQQEPQQQKILSSGSLKLFANSISGSVFPSSSPLRALEGAVLIGRC